MAKNDKGKENFISKMLTKISKTVNYCWTGVWKDTRDTTSTRVIKTINLSVRSFLDRDLQNRSMALTYSTVLAIVPAIALIFAIARGFGFQNLIEGEIYSFFPAQHRIIELAFSFVDSYLKQASQGIFVGIGIMFLLWTLISLLSNIEEAFNVIWDVKRDRSFYQKITDYIAICLLVPILMICSAGVSIFMSTTIQDNLQMSFLTPVVNFFLELAPVFLAFLAFSLSFFLIPNTRVQIKYALISGAICAIAFQILQLLFLNGQIYVSKYNAIYGSFSFLPLMLIWLQLSWLILLFGCVLTYSMQNVFAFNFIGDLKKMSYDYTRKVAIVLMTAIARRFNENKTPFTRAQLSNYYDIPIRVVTNLCELLHKAGLVSYIIMPKEKVGISPATDINKLTAGMVYRKISEVGESNFIPRFQIIYSEVLGDIDKWFSDVYASLDTHPLLEIDLPEDENKEKEVTMAENPFFDSGVPDPTPQSSDE